MHGEAMAEAIPVELEKTDDGWQLLRGGEPYVIRGAGGTQKLAALAAAGGNSLRTWSAEDEQGKDTVGALLDEAHALGLTVTVGIWLGHERHGFDYSDSEQVQAQFDRARRIVLRHKDHPAVLLWGVGNEMEGFEDGDDPRIWTAVNDIAAMIKELDSNHPVMTVTSFAHGKRVEFVHNRCPAVDIHGINAYGGAVVIPEFLEERGASKPYIVTEFGPVGPWEMPTTDWGAPIEQTSTDKAAFYERAWREGIEASPLSLGGYAFLWGHKMEATTTWFGMFLADGAATAAVDAMTRLWSGKPPDNLAPVVQALRVDGSAEVEPGAIVQVHGQASDPEGAALDVRWALRPESGDYMTGGDYRPEIPDIEGAIVEADATQARVRVPDEPGAYRVFQTVYDDAGKAGTANIPLLVKGEVRTRMPFVVYEDGFDNMPYAPSGWMGNTEALTLDGQHRDSCYQGDACIRLRYEGTYHWVAVAWQHPPHNWGEQDGGYDLSGATALEVWARGEYGGEKVGFGVGLLEADRDYPDSGIVKLDDIVLTHEWQRFEVPLKRVDLSSIKTGFVVSLAGRRTPVTVYLDRIRFIP